MGVSGRTHREAGTGWDSVCQTVTQSQQYVALCMSNGYTVTAICRILYVKRLHSHRHMWDSVCQTVTQSQKYVGFCMSNGYTVTEICGTLYVKRLHSHRHMWDSVCQTVILGHQRYFIPEVHVPPHLCAIRRDGNNITEGRSHIVSDRKE